MSKEIKHTVDVIIPTFNRYDLVDRAIASVMLQTYPVTKIILINDCSSDSFEPLLEKYGGEKLCIIRNEKNLGQHKSRLIGIQSSVSEYIALLDSDDWWAPDKIKMQIEVAESLPNGIISCRVRIHNQFSENKVVPRRVYLPHEKVEEYWFLEGGMLQTSTLFGAREIMRDIHEECADNDIHTDLTLVLLAQKNNYPIYQLEDSLTFFDSTLRSDRVSTNPKRIEQADVWFQRYTKSWRNEVKDAYLFNDRVPRYIQCGMYMKALGTLIQYYHPRYGVITPLRYLALIITRNKIKYILSYIRSLLTRARLE